MKVIDVEKVISLLEKVKKRNTPTEILFQALDENAKEYDTLVCLAVKKDPLRFVDILREQAEVAEKGECKPKDFAPLLREAACVIANLLLTEEDWHETVKKGGGGNESENHRR